MRSAFYYGLDDLYIQREVSNIKESDQSLKSFLDEAIAAESRAIHYKDTLDRSHALDCASELTPNTDQVVSRTDFHSSGNTNK